jgi:2-keto-3-deoxy-L-rhamnonate aldolase RhmA
MREPFRHKLCSHEPLIGTVITLASPAIAEICEAAGVDWLFLDMEHGQLELADVRQVIQAVGESTDVLVRVPENREVWAKRVLDLGATGLIFPQVKTADEAREICSWCRYSPAGSRSVGIARAHRYGNRFSEYLASANGSATVVLQIEHATAIANLQQILAVPGIDALFLGPYDLSASLGVPGRTDAPAVKQAMTKFRVACRAAKMPCGIFAPSNAVAKRYLKDGYTLLAVALDALLLLKSVKSEIAGLK